MLSKLKQSKAKRSDNSNTKGFTIIEVMIVLAIAGLILLIVFLAVPALQRSARNNQRKADIGRIGSAATTIISNNNGAVTAAALSSAAIQAEVGTRLAYYTSTNVTGGDSGTPADLVKVAVADNVRVVVNAKCGATPGADALVQTRQVAILYAIESGSGVTSLCVDQ